MSVITSQRKWSLLIRHRDQRTCRMCGRVGGPIEAHHIYPKSLYPDKALHLSNGVSLCFCCHRGVVHGGDTFDLSNWRVFVPMFRYGNGLAAVRRFNETYQR
jgi:hypothetical protein